MSALLQDLQVRPLPAAPSTALSLSNCSTPDLDENLLVLNKPIEESRGLPRVNIRTKRLMRLQVRLLGKALELIQQQAYGVCTNGFRTYNLRPFEALAFRHAYSGDIVALRQSFHMGQASAFDRNPHGHTLLHVRTDPKNLTVSAEMRSMLLAARSPP